MSGLRKGLCNFFARTGRCKFGASCKFSHDAVTGTQPTPSPATRSTYTSRRQDWSHSLTRDDALSSGQFDAAIRSGLGIVESGDSDAKQSLIKELGDEKGLQWISRALESNFSLQPTMYELGFHEHCVPFLQLISHEKILSSLVLEKSVGTIYNFVYGASGRRGIKFFEKTSALLKQALYDRGNTKCEEAIMAISAAFFSTINLNHEAAIQKEFKAITITLSQCFDEFPLDRRESFALRSAGRNIQRIKEHLQMGDAIPNVAHNVATTSTPMFQMHVDPPGDLSIKGPRHDNDKASIEEIQILPTTSEIKGNRAEYLPQKSKDFPHHEKGIHRLLDSQFRLLREDTAGQLRDAVCALVERWEMLVRGNDKNAKRKFLRQIDAKMSIYDRVKVSQLRFDRRKGMIIDASFAQPERVTKMKPRERADWWKDSRDLGYGNLVALIDDTMETTFLLVADRVVIRQRRTEETQDEYRHQGIKDLAGDPDRALISLTLVTPNSMLDQARIMSLVQQTTPGTAVLVEFPGMLYAAFEPVLSCLKTLHRQPILPFTNWLAPTAETQYTITNGIVQVPPPLYLSRIAGQELDLSCITNGRYPLRFSVQRPVTVEQLEQHTTLDCGQCESLIMSLKTELALVQGPPGTGKSYVGHKLVQVLLANRDLLKIGPIVCVCYTNHALDQFLGHLLDSGEEKIIRMGGQSKSERLAELMLHKVRAGTMPTRVEKRGIWQCQTAIEEIQTQMKSLLERSSRGCTHADIANYLQQHSQQTHDILFAGAKDVKTQDSDGGWKVAGKKTRSDIFRIWTQGKNAAGQTRDAEPQTTNRSLQQLLDNRVNPWETSHRERQTLRSHWEERVNEIRRVELQSCIDRYTAQNHSLQTQYKEGDKRCLEQAHVIGVTTSGLATNSELLRSIPAKVLVCEEAAEVLEAHLITAMLPSVEHAILIGDHLQLRAQISRYELSMESAQGSKYGLDESLFERLEKAEFGGGKMPIASLDVQRRMHPSIASLVRETLYPNLRDHPSTHTYPEVVGMRRRLFWLNHENREDSASSDGQMQTSKTNEYEAEVVVSLVRHLSRQGVYYGRDDIAVITPYLGQLRKLRKKLGSAFDLVIGEKDMEQIELEDEEEDASVPVQSLLSKQQVRKGRLLDGIRIATVDNFQGEEAKVIIVSLVRSNEEHRCGFLKTFNRINVLLSRAQHGMYIIGDAETSRPIDMWAKVLRMLEERGNIGRTLELKCPRHPDIPIHVACADDFTKLAPEGGCSERCGKRLTCGHVCLMKCHSDQLHELVKCEEDCIRSFPHCEHSCPKRCGESCGDCKERVTSNIRLPCGHSPASLECHETRDLAKVKCREKVFRQVPGCGHMANVQCHVDITTYRCESSCNSILPCGHPCGRKCKDCRKKNKDRPEIITMDHKECVVPCGRSYTTCNHACEQPCHPGEACKPCSRPCEVRCDHSWCPNKCSEPCPPCAAPCSWFCKHRSQPCHMPCAVPCDLIPCSVRCDKIMECGHQCPSICGETCPGKESCQICASDDILDTVLDLIEFTTYRETDLDAEPVIFLSCGHFYSVGTLDGLMDLKNAYVIDEEGNILEPKSFSRSDMKGCPNCRAPLRNIHRYNRVVKGALLDEATKRFMAYAGTLQNKLLEELEEKEHKLEDMINELILMITTPNGALFSTKTRILRYKQKGSEACQLVESFLNAVKQAEQPYGKVHSMVIDARRRRNAVTKFELDNTVIQHGFQLRGRSLLLRMMWAVLWNFKRLSTHIPMEDYVKEWKKLVIPSLKSAKDMCIELMMDSENTGYHKQEIEAMVWHAQFSALELCHSPDPDANPEKAKLITIEKNNLDRCLEIINAQPSAEYLREDVQKARVLIGGGTFYSFVSSEEKAAVYQAMAREFGGTGHWYYCQNGHPFTVGECGMPMQLARCSECDAPVGGQSHMPTAGVTRAADLEMQFGRMGI
ncbi:P-loop containing nucleoside triphosphate hydrolase protein [Wilcoxina mikolae CBS 423.85]|nr:P-loop containing nucleoside triphosphate hydrolase protein [Wilcoxina mikolae CBS 423.85]